MPGLSYNLMPRDEDDSPVDAQDSPGSLAGDGDALRGRLYGFNLVDEERPIAEGAQDDPNDVVAALYAELRPRLYGYLRNTMSMSEDQADEIIQESFLRLTARMSGGEEIQNPHGLVVRIARQFAIDVYRRRDRVQEVNVDKALPVERADPALSQEQQMLTAEKSPPGQRSPGEE